MGALGGDASDRAQFVVEMVDVDDAVVFAASLIAIDGP